MKSDGMKDQKLYEELEREARTLKRVANSVSKAVIATRLPAKSVNAYGAALANE